MPSRTCLLAQPAVAHAVTLNNVSRRDKHSLSRYFVYNRVYTCGIVQCAQGVYLNIKKFFFEPRPYIRCKTASKRQHGGGMIYHSTEIKRRHQCAKIDSHYSGDSKSVDTTLNSVRRFIWSAAARSSSPSVSRYSSSRVCPSSNCGYSLAIRFVTFFGTLLP